MVSEGVTIGDKAVIYPGCYIGPGTKIGSSSIIYPGVVIRDGMIIGNNVRIDDFCVLSAGEGGIEIEDFVHIAPNATLCGGVTVGEGTLIGAGSLAGRCCSRP